MYINQKLKFVFFHNPKTAGMSATEILGFETNSNGRFIHMPVDDAKEHIFQSEWPAYYSFAFVRNPWDRIVSLYSYHRSIEYGAFMNFNTSHQSARFYDFREWLLLNAQGEIKSNWFGKPQTLWTKTVSEVFRFEQFEESINRICDHFELPPKAIHRNKSKRSKFQDYYKDQQSIDIVAEIDADIIQEFQYDF